MLNDPPQIKTYHPYIATNSYFGSGNAITFPGTAVYLQISNTDPNTDSNAALACQLNGDPTSIFEVPAGTTQIFNRGEVAATSIDFANVSTSGGGGYPITAMVIASVVQG